MESKEISRFTVVPNEWNKPGISRIYFVLQEYGKSGRGNGQACYDVLSGEFIKCHNRVGAAWEHAIKEVFGLGEKENG